MRHVTIKDIARIAGVSTSTVSRALSGSKELSEATRERIVKICNEQGYRVNALARSLIRSRTNVIGLIVPEVTNPFYAEISLGIETHARELGYNVMLCNSQQDTKTTEELYPVDAGGGLRLASTLCTFSYIREGQQVQSAIGCINTSNRPVRLELHPKESSGLLAADYPRELAPGQTAEINLMYLNPEGAPRYGSLRDALEVRADGRGNGTLIVAHGIGIDKSPADARRTPKVQITENIIKFGPVKHNAPQQQRTFTLTNTGDGELIVRAVETGGKVATTLTPGQRIPAGSSFTAKATLDPGRQEYGVVTDFVTIITNDPTRPMRRLRATAIVED